MYARFIPPEPLPANQHRSPLRRLAPPKPQTIAISSSCALLCACRSRNSRSIIHLRTLAAKTPGGAVAHNPVSKGTPVESSLLFRICAYSPILPLCLQRVANAPIRIYFAISRLQTHGGMPIPSHIPFLFNKSLLLPFTNSSTPTFAFAHHWPPSSLATFEPAPPPAFQPFNLRLFNLLFLRALCVLGALCVTVFRFSRILFYSPLATSYVAGVAP